MKFKSPKVDFDKLPAHAQRWFIDYFIKYPKCEGNKEMNRLRKQWADWKYAQEIAQHIP